MHFSKKIESLKNRIFEQLVPLIKSDFVYLDLPYYDNIGDTLIWEGTEHFIKGLGYKCSYKSSIETFNVSKVKASEDAILLQGGGNFGDIWHKHQDFRLEIIKKYPLNKIIILPQTIYYEDVRKMENDAVFMAGHSDLTICARDYKSFGLLKKYFSNKILLLPDMAFCIPPQALQKYRNKESLKTLLLKRNDKEFLETNFEDLEVLVDDLEIRDWPSMEQRYFLSKLLYKMIDKKFISRSFVDWYANCFFKKNLIIAGTQFVSSYKDIYTTRLHVAILAVLLHKEFSFMDNSYGKNRTFFDTWLYDLENINFIEKN